MHEEGRFGAHLLRVEEPDFLYLEIQGPLRFDEMHALFREHDERLLATGVLFTLVDVSKAAGMERGAKNAWQSRPRDLPSHAVAIVGAPFRTRTFIDLLVRAIRTLTRAQVHVRFWPTEAEARVWLGEKRREFGRRSRDYSSK